MVAESVLSLSDQERLTVYGAYPWLFYGLILNIEPDSLHRIALHFQSRTVSMESTCAVASTEQPFLIFRDSGFT